MNIKIIEINNPEIIREMDLPVYMDETDMTSAYLILGAKDTDTDALVGVGVFRYTVSGFLESTLEFLAIDDDYIYEEIEGEIISYGAMIFKNNGYQVLRYIAVGDLDYLYTVNDTLSWEGFDLYDALRHRIIIDSSVAKESRLAKRYKHILEKTGYLIDDSEVSSDDDLLDIFDADINDNSIIKLFRYDETDEIIGYAVYEMLEGKLLMVKKLGIRGGMMKIAGPVLLGYILDSYSQGLIDDDWQIVMEFSDSDKIYNALKQNLSPGYTDEYVNEYMMIL